MHPNRWLAVIVAAGVAACGGDKSTDSPTAPELRPVRSGCSYPTLQQAVNDQFTGSTDTYVSQLVTSAKNDPTAANLLLYEVLDTLSVQYLQGTPQTASTVAYQALLCTTGGAAGLSATSFEAAFDTAGAFAPVGYTAEDDKTVESHDGLWVLHPPDDSTWVSISDPFPLIIYGAPVDISPAVFTNDPPLRSTTIFDWNSYPKGVKFDPKVIVGNCEQGGTTTSHYIQHNPVTSDSAEILDFVQPRCGVTFAPSQKLSLADRVLNFFVPTTAHAAFFLPTSGGQKGALSPDAAVSVDTLVFQFKSQPDPKKNQVGVTLFGKDGNPLTVSASSAGGTKFNQTKVFGWIEATNNQGSFVEICHNWVYSDEKGEFVFNEAVLNKAGGYVVTFKSPGAGEPGSAQNAPNAVPAGFVTTNLFNVKNGTASTCQTEEVYPGFGDFPTDPSQ
jgi:hypothetical protein